MKQHWGDQEGALSAIHDFCIFYPAKPSLWQQFLPFQGTWPASEIKGLKHDQKHQNHRTIVSKKLSQKPRKEKQSYI